MTSKTTEQKQIDPLYQRLSAILYEVFDGGSADDAFEEIMKLHSVGEVQAHQLGIEEGRRLEREEHEAETDLIVRELKRETQLMRNRKGSGWIEALTQKEGREV